MLIPNNYNHAPVDGDHGLISLLQILTFCCHDVHVLATVAVLVLDMVIIHFISLLCPCNLHSF
jgi:hypothetical protein